MHLCCVYNARASSNGGHHAQFHFRKLNCMTSCSSIRLSSFRTGYRLFLTPTPYRSLRQNYSSMPSPAATQLDLAPSGAGSRADSPSKVALELAPAKEEAKEIAKKVLTGIEASKQLAAFTAVDRHIKPEHRVRPLTDIQSPL